MYIHIRTYIIYIYIEIALQSLSEQPKTAPDPFQTGGRLCQVCRSCSIPPATRLFCAWFGWHDLSNSTCLMQPHSFYACVVVSRMTIIRYMIRHV